MKRTVIAHVKKQNYFGNTIKAPNETVFMGLMLLLNILSRTQRTHTHQHCDEIERRYAQNWLRIQ